jgi:YidC/Oxa1 family membrane protein insertase
MDSRRWIAFFLFTMGVVLLFQARMANRQKEAMEARKRAQESAALAERATSPTLESGTSEGALEREQASLREALPEEEPTPEDIVDRETAPTFDVRTESFEVAFSSIGALPIQWRLINLTAATSPAGDDETTGTVELIPQVYSSQREYPLNLEGRPLELFNDVPFTFESNVLPNEGVEVVLTSEERNGLQLVKSFQFPNKGFEVPFTLRVVNSSDYRKLFSDEGIGFGIGWQGGFLPPQERSRVSGVVTALVASPGGLQAERPSIGDEPQVFQGPIDWVGVERKFFLVGLIPQGGLEGVSALVTVRERDVTPEYRQKGVSPPVSVVLQQDRFELEPGQSMEFAYDLFAGPKNYDLLQSADKRTGLDAKEVGLSASVFHGTLRIIRWLSLILLDVLEWLHGLMRSYGFAIILLTILVRLVTYPLTHKSMKIQAKTMAQQAKLKPYIDEINKKYKDDAGKRNQAMMKLWKEHGVNPFGMLRGCIPVLFQMPVFIALYILLDQAIELRGQSFYWIKDLSMPDRLLTIPGISLPILGNSLNILPILMGVTQVVASRLSMSAATDSTQRQLMVIMPLAFVVFLYNFPSGLMLYWVVTNLWQIGQQKLTNRLIRRENPDLAPARG